MGNFSASVAVIIIVEIGIVRSFMNKRASGFP